MHDLAQFTLSDMTECGAVLRKLGRDAASMEEAARRIVRYLHEHLNDGESGNRSCVLVRFFKTHAYSDLSPELREFADRLLDGRPPTPSMKCLTLLATAGERPEWNDRQLSAGHKAIPLPTAGYTSVPPASKSG